jgi:branched-chain amino acid aminotransferase
MGCCRLFNFGTVRLQLLSFCSLALRDETPKFLSVMKNSNAGGVMIDEPEARKRVSKTVIKPAVETRSDTSRGAVKESKIFIDGKFYGEGDAKVSVFDHGLLYGDGIFEGIRFYNGRVFRLEEHLARLWDSARSICLAIPMSMPAMTDALLETVRQNDLRDGYIRLLVTRGVGNLGLNPTQCKHPSVIIIVATIALYPTEIYAKGLTVVTCPTRRSNPAALNPAVKSLNYLNNVMARIEANLSGADEALMLNDQGNVAECTADNVFVVKRGQIFTPPITAGALRGITRAVIFEIAAELGFKVTEADVTRHDVFVADECFLTGTAAEVIPVIKVDGRVIAEGKPGPISTRMMARFREMTHQTGTPIYS